jgi:hypothetical protein
MRFDEGNRRAHEWRRRAGHERRDPRRPDKGWETFGVRDGFAGLMARSCV